jgi:hypothetical protein
VTGPERGMHLNPGQVPTTLKAPATRVAQAEPMPAGMDCTGLVGDVYRAEANATPLPADVPWRVGSSWAARADERGTGMVTVVREGVGEPDEQGRRPGDELVAVAQSLEHARRIVKCVNFWTEFAEGMDLANAGARRRDFEERQARGEARPDNLEDLRARLAERPEGTTSRIREVGASAGQPLTVDRPDPGSDDHLGTTLGTVGWTPGTRSVRFSLLTAISRQVLTSSQARHVAAALLLAAERADAEPEPDPAEVDALAVANGLGTSVAREVLTWMAAAGYERRRS